MRRLSWMTLGNFIRLLSQAALILLAPIALGNLAGSEWGPLKKLVHFPAFWSPIALLLAIGFAFAKKWRWSASGLVLSVGFAAQVAALWIPPEALPPSRVVAEAKRLTVLSFNVFAGNHRHQDVLAALQKEQADVIYLTEMTPRWFAALAPLEKDYPHRVKKPGGSDWLLSRHPMEHAAAVVMTFDAAKAANDSARPPGVKLDETFRTSWHNDDLLVGTVLVNGKRLRVAGLHPPTLRRSSRVVQQRAFATLYKNELAADPNAHAQLLVGDFNTTVFSPTFRLILNRTGLHDTRQGFGYSPTWGPRLPREPILPWIGIPIDHILASPNIHILTHEIGPALGSDHRWVKVTFLVN